MTQTFRLTAKVTVSAYTEVEADSIEEAKEIAEGRAVGIGGPRAGNDPAEEWVIDDPDGEAYDLEEED